MPICSRCKLQKSDSEFYRKSGNNLRSECKECFRLIMRERSAAHYRSNREYYLNRNRKQRNSIAIFVRTLKEGKLCTDCGLPHPPWRLDFDHLRDKKFDIAAMISLGSRRLILEEVAKCEVVCANCHRDRTHRRKMERLAGVEPALTKSLL